eukprot:GCRY01001884.1.p1 GENE.GCRY01001884.1~~GCRY01001884.1.p1  ORF type:complete len:326 (-),score=54.86 GCRY01001884.1:324-1223(-)
MDIEICWHNEYIGSNGHVLNAEEKTFLQTSLKLVKNDYKMKYLFFFGKVLCVEGQYYVAFGTSDSLFGKKTIFCSLNAIDWVQLPEPSQELVVKKKILALSELFSGDFGQEYTIDLHVHNEPKPETLEEKSEHGEEEEEAEEEEEEEEENGDNAVIVKEEERLYYTLEALIFDTDIVPRRALFLTATDDVVPNRMFEGLSLEEADKIQFYFHKREPVHLQQKTLLEREQLLKAVDFMDSIAEDFPKGSWALRFDPLSNLVTIRSLVWPGFTFTHAPKSKEFSSLYFGNLVRTSDLGFLL